MPAMKGRRCYTLQWASGECHAAEKSTRSLRLVPQPALAANASRQKRAKTSRRSATHLAAGFSHKGPRHFSPKTKQTKKYPGKRPTDTPMLPWE